MGDAPQKDQAGPVSPGEGGFGQEDRTKVVWGIAVTVGGGVAFAIYQGLDFVLQDIFGLRAFGNYVVVLSLVEFLGHLLLAGFLDAVTVFVSRVVHGAEAPLGKRPVSPQLDRVLATCVLVPFVVALILALGISVGADAVYDALWSRHDLVLKELVQVSVWALPLMVLMHVPVEALKAYLDVRASVFVTQILFPYGVLALAMAFHFVGGMGIEAMAYALVCSAGLCVPISLWLCSRAIRLGPVIKALFSQGPDREVLAFAVPQSLNMAFNLGMVRIDALVLSTMPGISAQAIGLYGLAVRATSLIRLLKMAFSGMFGPLAAKYHASSNRRGLTQALHRFTQVSSALGVPAFLLVMSLFPHYAVANAPVLAEQGLAFVWVLCVGPLAACFVGFAGNLLLMTGHSRLLLLNSSLAFVLNLLLNLWLIPIWGLLGAAVATGVANLAMAIAQAVEMQRVEGYRWYWSVYRASVLAGVIPVVLLAALHSPWLQPMLQALTPSVSMGLGVSTFVLYVLLWVGASGVRWPAGGLRGALARLRSV